MRAGTRRDHPSTHSRSSEPSCEPGGSVRRPRRRDCRGLAADRRHLRHGAAMSGTAQLGEVEVPVGLSASDLFDLLEFGAMAAYRVENDTWSFTTDATFVGLGRTPRPRRAAPRRGRHRPVHADGHCRPPADRQPGVPLRPRLPDLSSDVKVESTSGDAVNLRISADADWIDPTLGLRYSIPLGEAWRLNLRATSAGSGSDPTSCGRRSRPPNGGFSDTAGSSSATGRSASTMNRARTRTTSITT